MESFWHSLKVEETHGRGFETREEARRSVFAYIEGLYNTTRMHSSINWMSPRKFQKRFDATLRAEQQQRKHVSASERSEPPLPSLLTRLLIAWVNHSLKCLQDHHRALSKCDQLKKV